MPPRRFDPAQPEVVDRADTSRETLRAELLALAELNRKLGAHALALDQLKRFLAVTQLKSLSILDLGTGIGDIPRAIADWARKAKISVSITGVDNNPTSLDLARETAGGYPEIDWEQADLRTLPHPPGSYDLVLCSLALHHFNGPDAVTILKRIQEIARVGYIVNDLRRNGIAVWSTVLLAPFFHKNQTFQKDAIHSSRAAWSIDELRLIAERAKLENYVIRRHHWFFRMAIEGKK